MRTEPTVLAAQASIYPIDPVQLDHQDDATGYDDIADELHERHHVAEVMLRARFQQKKMRAHYA